MPPTFRAVSLAVVSSPGQAMEDRYSLPEQVQMNARAAERLDAQIVTSLAFQHSRWFKNIDDLCASSPDYARFIELVRSKAVDLVILTMSDRMGRTTLLQLLVIDLCWEMDVQIYTVSEPFFDPIDPQEFKRNGPSEMERRWRGMLAQEAEAYIRAFVAHSRRGKHGRATAGLHLSFSNPPYGYQDSGDPKTPHVINPLEARWVRRIGALRAQGYGSYVICRMVKVEGMLTRKGTAPMPAQILRIYKNPYYAGFVRHRQWSRHQDERRRVVVGEELFDGLHEPIWSPELWETIQRMNASARRDYAHDSDDRRLLTGMLRCGPCRVQAGVVYGMTYGSGNGTLSLRCSAHVRGRQCPDVTNYHNADHVHALISERVRQVIERPDVWRAAQQNAQPDSHAGEIAMLERALEDLSRRQERLADAVETGVFPLATLVDRQAAINRERADVQGRLDELSRQLHSTDRVYGAMISFRSLLGAWDDLPNAQRRTVYLTLIDHVELTRGVAPVIYWAVN